MALPERQHGGLTGPAASARTHAAPGGGGSLLAVRRLLPAGAAVGGAE